MIYVGLIAGLVILLVSGDILVRGAVSLAVNLGLPVMIIGLTIVAFGTSAPELVVSVSAALSGASGIAIGNVVGSNICNALLVLGLPALIAPTDCDQPHLCRNTFYVVAASVLFIAMCFYGPLSFWHGAVLFALIIAFLVESGYRTGRRPRKDPTACEEEELETIDGVPGVPHATWMIVIFMILGIAGLPLGGHLIIENGTAIARSFGVPEATIGLTLIAFGTSLPELATTLSAALRGHCAVALGNVLGSNLFNILAIMGVTAMLAPVDVPPTFLRFDLWIMLAATLVIVPFALGRTHITRLPAMALVLAYVAYMVFVLTPEQVIQTVATAQ